MTAMTERQLQEAILELAKVLKWRTAHFRPARVTRHGKEIYETPVAGDGKGFPDLIMVRRSRMIVAELKSHAGSLRPDQELWLNAFRDVFWGLENTLDVYVWQPNQWLDGTIERVLR